jgi:hypothetical protein
MRRQAPYQRSGLCQQVLALRIRSGLCQQVLALRIRSGLCQQVLVLSERPVRPAVG